MSLHLPHDTSSSGGMSAEDAQRATEPDAESPTPHVKKKVGRPLKYQGDPNSPHLSEMERRRLKRRQANRESARRIRQKRMETKCKLEARMTILQEQTEALLIDLEHAKADKAALLQQWEAMQARMKTCNSENSRLKRQVSAMSSGSETTGARPTVPVSGAFPTTELFGGASARCQPTDAAGAASKPAAVLASLGGNAPALALPVKTQPPSPQAVGLQPAGYGSPLRSSAMADGFPGAATRFGDLYAAGDTAFAAMPPVAMQLTAPAVTTGEFTRPDPTRAPVVKLPGGRRATTVTSFRPGFTITTAVAAAGGEGGVKATTEAHSSPVVPLSPASPDARALQVQQAAAVGAAPGCGPTPPLSAADGSAALAMLLKREVSVELIGNPFGRRMVPDLRATSSSGGSTWSGDSGAGANRLACRSTDSDRTAVWAPHAALKLTAPLLPHAEVPINASHESLDWMQLGPGQSFDLGNVQLPHNFMPHGCM